MNPSELIPQSTQQALVALAQALVRIPSLSGQEGQVIRFIEQQMQALGYEEVKIDAIGNVVGRIGHGEKTILFDSHVDTVDVKDAGQWRLPPFSGELQGGRLHGRGSVDMKSAAAASIYAAVLAQRLGLTEGVTVYISCSVFEEDCDGEALQHLLAEQQIRPDWVVICEPSNNHIALGHKGKAQVTIQTHGVSAHGSAPEKGVNAIYEMAEIIRRVEQRNLELMRQPEPRPTLVMSRISSSGASLNAVPSECEVYLDRRMIPGETDTEIRQEMEQLVAGKNASWAVDVVHRKSWSGMEITYTPFHLAWKIDLQHPLAQACMAAYRQTFGSDPGEFVFWDFSTNAVTPVRMGIPTIGFGPGEYKLAHMRDESIAVRQIVEACAFYTRLIGQG